MAWQVLLLVPVAVSALYWVVAAVCVAIFLRRGADRASGYSGKPFCPPVSLLKPVCGLEKGLGDNLATACHQDYPAYEVIFGVQRKSDPALEVIENVAAICPQRNTRIVVDETTVGPNGKINNLHNMCQVSTGDILVFSDSDMQLAPDHLKCIVAPLVDERIGICCALYRAERPENLFEVLELLSYNADFIVSILFAVVTGTAPVCPGAALAIRRHVLDAVGGLAPLGDFLAEDYEMGRRVAGRGYRIHFIPSAVAMRVDLSGPEEWWRHQVGWDQKTKSANPSGFFFTLLIRGVPFAVLYAASGAPFGLHVLLATILLRLATGLVNAVNLQDRDGMAFIWLLPVRDLFGLFVWLAALMKRTTSWRGRTFRLKKGRLTEKRQ